MICAMDAAVVVVVVVIVFVFVAVIIAAADAAFEMHSLPVPFLSTNHTIKYDNFRLIEY